MWSQDFIHMPNMSMYNLFNTIFLLLIFFHQLHVLLFHWNQFLHHITDRIHFLLRYGCCSIFQTLVGVDVLTSLWHFSHFQQSPVQYLQLNCLIISLVAIILTHLLWYHGLQFLWWPLHYSSSTNLFFWMLIKPLSLQDVMGWSYHLAKGEDYFHPIVARHLFDVPMLQQSKHQNVFKQIHKNINSKILF